MKEVFFTDDKDSVLKCFSNSDVILYLWQTKDGVYSRQIHPSLVEKLNKDELSITFQTRDYSHFTLETGEMFCFNEDLKSFFKLRADKISGHKLFAKVPDKISILTEEENQQMNECLYEVYSDYLSGLEKKGIKTYESKDKMVYEGPRENIDLGVMKIRGHVEGKRSQHDLDLLTEQVSSISLDEEDKMFAGQRNAPRAKPKADKTVTLIDSSNESQTYKLYDLSMGGMSIISEDITYLDKDEEISILGFDDKNFEDPMRAIIRNIRDIEDLPGHYKIGMQFLEDA